MPIYEFKCKACDKQFEQLCKIEWQGTVHCPGCGSENIQKILSCFASSGGGSCGCGSCSSKSCGSCK